KPATRRSCMCGRPPGSAACITSTDGAVCRYSANRPEPPSTSARSTTTADPPCATTHAAAVNPAVPPPTTNRSTASPMRSSVGTAPGTLPEGGPGHTLLGGVGCGQRRTELVDEDACEGPILRGRPRRRRAVGERDDDPTHFAARAGHGERQLLGRSERP